MSDTLSLIKLVLQTSRTTLSFAIKWSSMHFFLYSLFLTHGEVYSYHEELIIPDKIILTRILAWFAVRGLPSVQTVKSCRSSGIPLCKRVGSPSFLRWGSMQWGNCSKSPAFSSMVSVAMSPEFGETGYFLVSKYLERRSNLLLYSNVRFWKVKTLIKASKRPINISCYQDWKRFISLLHELKFGPKIPGKNSHFQ